MNIEGQYQEAIAAYSLAIKLNPNNLDYFKNRAMVKKEVQDVPGALKDLNHAQALDSTLSEIYYMKGNIYRTQKQHQKALEMYTMAIYCYNKGDHSLKPFPFFFNRVNTYLEKSQFKKALLDYNIGLRINPQHSPSYCNRGTAKYQLKDKIGAIADWKMAVKGGINQASVYLEKYKTE